MVLPTGPLFAWYGDDFTGSAAVMEEFAFAGIQSVLFLDVPDEEQLSRFSSAQTIGLAGTSRAHGPQWMERHLPRAFEFLKSTIAPLNLYKICSTLDSSPDIGSIGKALSIARVTFGQAPIPSFPASPKLGRYQCFGNLFARAGETVYRLDRHPIVSHHPVTPMDEADVAKHLLRQTDESIGLITLPDLPRAEEVFAERLRAGNGLVSIDAVSQADLIQCGRLFVSLPYGSLLAGSQGVAEALVEFWRAAGDLPAAPKLAEVGPAQGMVGISGSLSSITQAQIDRALEGGFVGLQLDTVRCLGAECESAINEVTMAALSALSQGKSPLVFSARGGDDPAVGAYKQAAERLNLTREAANQRIGEALGDVLAKLVDAGAVTRAAIAGGDSSGYALKRLDRLALTALAPTSPGAGIYLAHPRTTDARALEIALKGGQMGSVEYFAEVRAGRSVDQSVASRASSGDPITAAIPNAVLVKREL